MKIVQHYLTQNPCYKVGKTITVKGLMLHSVGCNQPSAAVFLRTWNPPANGREVCVHAFIDGNDGTVYQTLPWNHRGWHGGGKSNNTHIGVEMCEPASIRYTGGASFKDLDPVNTEKVVRRTYNAAVELFAFLCEKYGLDPMLDIISHSEGHSLGLASNHGDPEHLWKKFGLSMDGFRKAVQAQMKSGGKVTPSKGENSVQTPSGSSYRVKVTATALNIRAGAGTNYKINGCIKDKGVYTIVQTQGDWGKLKSGAGWIHLGYTKKL